VKPKIHPRYQACSVHCACGNTFVTRSTVAKINVDICSACHPFFTGKQKFVDTAGRVERFSKKFGGNVQLPEDRHARAGCCEKVIRSSAEIPDGRCDCLPEAERFRASEEPGKNGTAPLKYL